MRTATHKILLLLLIPFAVAISAQAATLNEWLFDEPPAGASFVASNEVPGGAVLTEQYPGIAFADLQVAGGPFPLSVGVLQTGGGGSNNGIGRATTGLTDWTGKTAFTIEMWVNAAVSAGSRDIVNDRGQIMRLNPTTGGFFLQGFIYDGGYRSTATGTILIPYDTWTHVALTYNGSAIQTYIGGVSNSSFTITSTLQNQNSLLTVGAFNANASTFKGYIDEVRISDVALLPGNGSGNGVLAWDASLVPEPSTFALIGMATLVAFINSRKRFSKKLIEMKA